EFPILYAISREGVAKKQLDDSSTNLKPLFDQIIETIPAPHALRDDSLQLLVANVDYNEYVGRLAIGRIFSGEISRNQEIVIAGHEGAVKKTRVKELYVFEGLKRELAESAGVGEIVALAGVEDINIGETITTPDNPKPLPVIAVDEPTIAMIFSVNNSPFAGTEGQFVTSRQINERLDREFLGVVTEAMGRRKGQMTKMVNHGTGRVRLEFETPSRGLIGFRGEFLTETKGTGLLNTIFLRFDKWMGEMKGRGTGSLVADRM